MRSPKKDHQDSLQQPMPLWQKIVALVIAVVFLSLTMGSVLALFMR